MSQPSDEPGIRGRGAADNPTNRFETLAYVSDENDVPDMDRPAPATLFLRDRSQSLLVRNQSPDVGFDVSINPYRGCEHGCIYCYARPTHEYLGFSAGLDFETKIMVKENAPELLRKELMSKHWQPQTIAISGVTDCYQPIERSLRLTRRCLEVLAEFRNPVGIITKNHLVARDVDVLAELAAHQAVVVYISLTSLDGELLRRLEPRATAPAGRLRAMEELTAAGVPVGVLVAPVIPGLTEHEIPTVLKAAASAGARFAGYTTLRLPFGLPQLFTQWLERHYPDRKERILGRIRELRGGKLNDPHFGSRMRGQGELADVIADWFKLARRQAGISNEKPPLSTANFRRPGLTQGCCFEGIFQPLNTQLTQKKQISSKRVLDVDWLSLICQRTRAGQASTLPLPQKIQEGRTYRAAQHKRNDHERQREVRRRR